MTHIPTLSHFVLSEPLTQHADNFFIMHSKKRGAGGATGKFEVKRKKDEEEKITIT